MTGGEMKAPHPTEGLQEVQQNGPSGKSAKRCQWQKKRGGFEEVPRLADTTVAGNRLARRWAREPRPYGSATRGAMGGRPQGSPLRKRCKECDFYRAGRCGERTERCRWQRKRSERVAAVKILSVRRKAAQKFWAPQQGHRSLRKITRSAVVIGRGDVGIGPYGGYKECVGEGLCPSRGRPQGSPLRKRYKGGRGERNPPVTAAPCQPPLGKGALGTGDADCHSQCAHWLRNDTLQEMLWLSGGGVLFRSRSSGRGFL